MKRSYASVCDVRAKAEEQLFIAGSDWDLSKKRQLVHKEGSYSLVSECKCLTCTFNSPVVQEPQVSGWLQNSGLQVLPESMGVFSIVSKTC